MINYRLLFFSQTMYCPMCIAIDPGGTEVFVVISKPKIEEKSIGSGGTTIQSSMEENFQLQIPHDSFDEDTKVLLKVNYVIGINPF